MKAQKYTTGKTEKKSWLKYHFSVLLGTFGIGSYNKNSNQEYEKVMKQAQEASKRTEENLARADKVLKRAEETTNNFDEVRNQYHPN